MSIWRTHLCVAIGCTVKCPPAVAMCAAHWRAVDLQTRVQYHRFTPSSPGYALGMVAAASEAVTQVARVEGVPTSVINRALRQLPSCFDVRARAISQ